jgi:hypothetical protein
MIEHQASYTSSVINTMIVALFQDGTANALVANVGDITVASRSAILGFKYAMVAGTTISTTFKVRAGGSIAGTTGVNGRAGSARFNGVAGGILTEMEIMG